MKLRYLAALLLLLPFSQMAKADLCADPTTHAWITCQTTPTTISTTPVSFGTSLSPVVLNSYTITGTVSANSTTFTCVTNCSSLAVGQGVTGSDGVNLIYPSTGGQFGALITQIVGTTITTSNASNSLTTPGTYTLTIGKDRWSTTSTAVANTLGTKNLWMGGAALGNSTWAQQYLSGDCDTGSKVTNCSLMNNGSGSVVNNFWGARTSDNTAGSNVEANISLAVNDDAVNSQAMWNHYWETIILPGAAPTSQSRALESTIYNYNSTVPKPDPWAVNKNGGMENIRLSTGQSNVGTLYNAMDALSIVGINSSVFEVGILFDATSLDQSTTAHPPAVALPSGANGYGITWYEATGYTTPSWNLYSTSTANSGNLFALNDTTATVTIPNDLSSGVVTMGSGYLGVSGNHTGTFSGSGLNFDIASSTINDPGSSGTVATASLSHIGLPTLTATSATTITTASTLAITGCPVASTNVTITNCFAFRVFGDTSRFDGSLIAAGGLTVMGKTLWAGTAFTLSGGAGTCATTSTLTGGTNAGKFTATGSTGTCAVKIVLPAATNDVACFAYDFTHYAVASITAQSTTGCTISVAATANDVIYFGTMEF